MQILPGSYDVKHTAVYVASINGAVWDYKVIMKTNAKAKYLVANELISGTTIYKEIIKPELYIKESEILLEKESASLPI